METQKRYEEESITREVTLYVTHEELDEIKESLRSIYKDAFAENIIEDAYSRTSKEDETGIYTLFSLTFGVICVKALQQQNRKTEQTSRLIKKIGDAMAGNFKEDEFDELFDDLRE